MNELLDKVRALKDYINDTFDIGDEDLASDMDMLVNADSVSDLSLTTLIKYLENDEALEEQFEENE